MKNVTTTLTAKQKEKIDAEKTYIDVFSGDYLKKHDAFIKELTTQINFYDFDCNYSFMHIAKGYLIDNVGNYYKMDCINKELFNKVVELNSVNWLISNINLNTITYENEYKRTDINGNNIYYLKYYAVNKQTKKVLNITCIIRDLYNSKYNGCLKMVKNEKAIKCYSDDYIYINNKIDNRFMHTDNYNYKLIEELI